MRQVRQAPVAVLIVLALLLSACAGGNGGGGDGGRGTTTYAPRVVTGDATGVATTLATLNGDLTDLGTASDVSVSFQWGTASGVYSNETAAQGMTATSTFSVDLTGLSLDTTYYFRAKATGDGTSCGNEQSFTTSEAVQSPLLTVALDYYGIRDTHNMWAPIAKIRLTGAVWDDERNLGTFTIPPEEIDATEMDYFEVKAVAQHRDDPTVFTGTVAGTLTVCVAAYNVSNGPIEEAIIDAFSQSCFDASYFKSLIPDKEYLGSCYYTWSQSTNWGIETGDTPPLESDDGNFLVWLRIGGSGQVPDLETKPELNPRVEITDLTLPANAKVGGWYNTTFTVTNHESFDIRFYWEADSSVTGTHFDGENSLLVYASNSWPITRSYYYSIAGPVEATYKIYWDYGDHRKLDSRSGTMVVSP